MIRAIYAAEGPYFETFSSLQPVNVGNIDRMKDVIVITLGFAATRYVSTLSGCC